MNYNRSDREFDHIIERVGYDIGIDYDEQGINIWRLDGTGRLGVGSVLTLNDQEAADLVSTIGGLLGLDVVPESAPFVLSIDPNELDLDELATMSAAGIIFGEDYLD